MARLLGMAWKPKPVGCRTHGTRGCDCAKWEARWNERGYAAQEAAYYAEKPSARGPQSCIAEFTKIGRREREAGGGNRRPYRRDFSIEIPAPAEIPAPPVTPAAAAEPERPWIVGDPSGDLAPAPIIFLPRPDILRAPGLPTALARRR